MNTDQMSILNLTNLPDLSVVGLFHIASLWLR